MSLQVSVQMASSCHSLEHVCHLVQDKGHQGANTHDTWPQDRPLACWTSARSIARAFLPASRRRRHQQSRNPLFKKADPEIQHVPVVAWTWPTSLSGFLVPYSRWPLPRSRQVEHWMIVAVVNPDVLIAHDLYNRWPWSSAWAAMPDRAVEMVATQLP